MQTNGQTTAPCFRLTAQLEAAYVRECPLSRLPLYEFLTTPSLARARFIGRHAAELHMLGGVGVREITTS